MRIFYRFTLAVGLAMLLTLTAYAQTSAQKPADTSPRSDELVRLLPASDLIAVIDLKRAFVELLPQLANINLGGIDKLATDIRDFTNQTGIDPGNVRAAVLGASMSGLQASGVLIVDGLDMDDAKMESAIKVFESEYSQTEYKGTKIYNLVTKSKGPSAGPLSVKMDEMAVAKLSGLRLVIGDLSAVKGVIDINAGSAGPGVSEAMISSLNETKATSLVRFALNLPDDLRQEAATQGDLFKSISAIKMILGTFDVAGDLSLSLDTILRTASQNDAVELETGLNGLVGLLRAFLGGNDPNMNIFNVLLDNVKIGTKVADVTLSLNLPRSVLDQLTKK